MDEDPGGWEVVFLRGSGRFETSLKNEKSSDLKLLSLGGFQRR